MIDLFCYPTTWANWTALALGRWKGFRTLRFGTEYKSAVQCRGLRADGTAFPFRWGVRVSARHKAADDPAVLGGRFGAHRAAFSFGRGVRVGAGGPCATNESAILCGRLRGNRTGGTAASDSGIRRYGIGTVGFGAPDSGTESEATSISTRNYHASYVDHNDSSSKVFHLYK